MIYNDRIEIPQVDIPDEISHRNQPEVEIETPHPVVPNPEGQEAKEEITSQDSERIGFV